MSLSKDAIASLRSQFLAQCSGDRFHPKDVERVKINDWTVERFALVNKTEEKALKHLIKTMEWRKSFGINDFTDESFPKEMWKAGYINIYPHKDREGRTVVWCQLSHFHKSDLTPMWRQMWAYILEKADRDTSHQGWAMVSDPTDAGLSNIDMDFTYANTDVMQSHFPRGPKYLAVVDLPWILNATAKLVLAFMNEELNKAMAFINKDELTKYLPPEHIPVGLNGTKDKDIITVPSGAKPLEQFSQFSAEQVKKIRSNYKKELNIVN